MSAAVALARLDLVLFLRSQRFVPPLVAWAAALALLYQPSDDRPLEVLGTAAAVLFPLAAWTALVFVGVEPATQRHTAGAAAGSATRAWAAKAIALGGLLGAVCATTVALPAVAGTFSTDPSSSDLLLAFAATVLSAIGGAGIGVLCGAPFISAAGWRVLACGIVLVLTIPLSAATPTRFVVPTGLQFVSFFEDPGRPSTADWLGTVLVPSVVSSALLLLAIVVLARRAD